MSEFNPTFDQSYRYFSYRLADQRVEKRDATNVRCPFHGDTHASMSLNLAHGLWNCHACGMKGGILDFERKMFNSTAEDAWTEIYKILGIEPPKQTRKLVKVYDYTDVAGRTLYQKLRYEPKNFSQRQPDGKGGWWYNLQGVKKVLYNLPRVVTAKYVAVVEGEKDADNLQAALDASGVKDFAVTTTFDGAGHWKAEYAPYFSGKMVCVFPDNDSQGRGHAQTVAASATGYAAVVKVVQIPDLPEKGDVSDWLPDHKVRDLLALVQKTPVWEPVASDHVLLEEAHDFLDRAPEEREWLVENMIPAGTRGLLVADPKVGKSALALDLTLALASGSSFLGHIVPRRRRVALISREDTPGETSRRMRLLTCGSAARAEFQWGQIWVNTVAQSDQWFLDNAEHVEAMIKELKMEQFDLVIFDVLRKLHNQDENDNAAMSTMVISTLELIQTECRCAVLAVHHRTKMQTANVFRDARGTGAIHGYTEWGIGLSVVDESAPRREWIRKAEFEGKYGCPSDPIFFRITGDEEALRLELTETPEPRPTIAPRRSKVREITSAADGKQRAAGSDE